MILGAVLAGGQSRRFGSDKALADWQGQTLLEHAVWQLSQWCEGVVVFGRDEAPAPCLPDWPRAGLGPLGGMAAALRHAGACGFDTVLSCGVDAPNLPGNLLTLLDPAPACCKSQPVIGLWPVSSLAALEVMLQGAGRRSLYGFAESIGARLIELPVAIANINTEDDLASLQR